MCLLHYLSENAHRLGISVCAASFDHMLRGEESASDCRFVADWCSKHGIECLTGSGDVRRRAELEGMSEEEAARVLERVSRKENCYAALVFNKFSDARKPL